MLGSEELPNMKEKGMHTAQILFHICAYWHDIRNHVEGIHRTDNRNACSDASCCARQRCAAENLRKTMLSRQIRCAFPEITVTSCSCVHMFITN
jgi:hypothetical protein